MDGIRGKLQLKENGAVIYSVDGSVEVNARKIYARSDVLMQSDDRSRGSGDVETRAIYRFRPSASGLDRTFSHSVLVNHIVRIVNQPEQAG